MPSIAALLHTENDALRLGRCLETLYPCDEILIVDHESRDATVHLAREYGARVIAAQLGAPPDHYLESVRAGWVLCLDPRESLTESLAASLYELRSELRHTDHSSAPAFSLFLREETLNGWVAMPAAQTRLIPQHWNRWHERLPLSDQSAVALEGELLRFVFP
jgi:glycosyltransferase involved in cell wall biosynthesis